VDIAMGSLALAMVADIRLLLVSRHTDVINELEGRRPVSRFGAPWPNAPCRNSLSIRTWNWKALA